jgi:hypothetical protein
VTVEEERLEEERGGGPGTTAAAVTALVAAVGLVGAVVALIRDRNVSAGMALGYYLVGAVVILAGSAPRGGFSVIRARWSQRRPTGSGGYALEGIAVGALLIGIGVLLDLTRPF